MPIPSPRITAKFLFLMREMYGKPRMIWKGMGMNLSRILLAALGAFVAYFLFGDCCLACCWCFGVSFKNIRRCTERRKASRAQCRRQWRQCLWGW
jgi:hypothetical protein